MAIIGKIREKSWLILIIVGGALLAFILTDYQKMTGNTEYQYGYGTVYGEMVDMDAFNKEYNLAQENADMQADAQRQPRQPVDKAAVWSTFVDKIILEKEFNALGIEVSDAEFDAYLFGKNGFSVLPDIEGQFKDSVTGMFNEKLLQSTIEQLENSENPEDVQRWETSKEYYMGRRKEEKYYDILTQGLYVTNLEAKDRYMAEKESKSISYVFMRYADVKDEDIDASEAKLKKYFEEHMNDKKYANRIASREVKFFDITIAPSKKDSASFNKTMTELKTQFMATENDSLFVLKNSDMKVFSSTHMATFMSDKNEKARQGATYPSYLDTVFMQASNGDVVGPYEDNGNTRIAKVLDFNENKLTARHILISAPRADEAAVAKAKKTTDSILPLLTSANFEEYVKNFSQDPGSVENGGKYEDFMDYEMVPEFSNFASQEPIGKIGYVQTDYGFHIMEVLERKPIKYPVLAIVQKTLKASQETIDDKEMEVDKLIYKLSDEMALKEQGKARVDLFDTIVSQAGYFSRTLTIEENNPKAFGFTSEITENKLFELAYSEGAMVGDLISSPIKEGSRYIIAVLAGIKEKGTPKYEDVQPAIERDYIKERKAMILKDKMLKGNSLKQLEKMYTIPIQKSDITFANPQINGAGFEPEVVGALFSGLKDGERTVPLEGNAGVYVVQIEKTTKAPAAANYMVERDVLTNERVQNVRTNAKKGLTKLADVVDNRRFFEYNIRR